MEQGPPRRKAKGLLDAADTLDETRQERRSRKRARPAPDGLDLDRIR